MPLSIPFYSLPEAMFSGAGGTYGSNKSPKRLCKVSFWVACLFSEMSCQGTTYKILGSSEFPLITVVSSSILSSAKESEGKQSKTLNEILRENNKAKYFIILILI